MGHGAYQVTTLGGCSPRQGQGQGQHTQGGEQVVVCTEAMVVG